MANIVRRFGAVLLSRFGEVLLGVLIAPVLVRLLGPAQYGEYATVVASAAVLMVAVEAGTFDGIRKHVAERRDVRDWQSRVFGFYLRISVLLAVAVATAVLAAAAAGIPDAVFGPGFAAYFLVVPGLLVAEQLFVLARGTLLGTEREARSESLVVARTACYGVLAIGLAALGYGALGVVVGNAVAALAAALVGLVVVGRHVPLGAAVARAPRSLPIREFLSFNSLNVALSALVVSLYHADVLLIQALSGSEQTGYYKAALVVAEFVWFAPQAVQLVVLQSSSRLWSLDRRDSVQALVARTTRYALLAALLFAVGIGALAEPFVALYFGDAFTPAVAPLLVLLPGAVGFAVARPILSVGQGAGAVKPLVVASGIAAALNIALNVALIPRFGIVGAAVGTTVGYGTMAVTHLRAARTIGLDPGADLRLGRGVASAALAAAILFPLAAVLPDAVALAVVPPVGLAAFVASAVGVGAVDRDELATAVRRLRTADERAEA